MSNGLFSRSKLARFIVDELERGAPVESMSKHVSAYLINSGKTAELNSLLRDIAEERARRTGHLEVTAISAFEITSEEKEEIERLSRQQYPTVKRIVINNELDPQVIGGLRLLFPHDQLDLSIRSKLNSLANAR
jgi:F0F1-type ATP synthase delta subunit